MDITIEDCPVHRVAAQPHQGPYQTIATAFAKLIAIAGAAGLMSDPQVRTVGIYRDDPRYVPIPRLRCAAGVIVSPDAVIPPSLMEIVLPAGRWASTVHQGPYAGLADTWDRVINHWLPDSGHRMAPTDFYEMYLNRPDEVPAEQLRTRLYVMLQ